MILSESGLKSVKLHLAEKSVGHTTVVMKNVAGLGRKLLRQAKRETTVTRPQKEISNVGNTKSIKHPKLPNLTRGATEHLKNVTAVKESDVKEHSDAYINAIIEAVAVDGADGIDIPKLFEAAPAVTSSGVGQFAIAALSAVVENDTLAKNFLDMELIESVPVLYFTKPVVGAKIKEEINTVLEAFGVPEVLVNYDDPIGEGQKSELLAIGLPFVTEKAEAVLGGLAANIEEASKPKKKMKADDEDDEKTCA